MLCGEPHSCRVAIHSEQINLVHSLTHLGVANQDIPVLLKQNINLEFFGILYRPLEQMSVALKSKIESSEIHSFSEPTYNNSGAVMAVMSILNANKSCVKSGRRDSSTTKKGGRKATFS